MTDELLTAPAMELARMVREREVSCAEVAHAHLREIARVNPLVHAVVQSDPDAVMRAARLADEALASGADIGPLHGVPFTAKDWLETSDYICAAGFEERREYVPKRDATAVARMRAAGAILLGKTNVNFGAPVYEPPRNPHDLSRATGGSSSGEAAIIAAGGSPLGLGSDSGGSIRLPAAWCGVAGLKPTTGLVPSTGHFPRLMPTRDPRSTIGPLARRVEDLLPTLRAIAGPDGRDARTAPVPIDDDACVDVSSLRVAWYGAMPGASPGVDVLDAVRTAVDALRDSGAGVREATPPRLEESMPITKAYWGRTESLSTSEWRPYRVSNVTADEIERLFFEWDRFRMEMLRFMDDYEIIVCPASEEVAPGQRAAVDEDFTYTLPYSLTGYPVVCVRAATSAAGLPVGVQVIAGAWQDHIAIAAARVIEQASGGWRRAVVGV
jgi:amidase